MEKLRFKTRPVWLQSRILFSPLCMGPRAATLLFAEMETWLHFQAPKFRSELCSPSPHPPHCRSPSELIRHYGSILRGRRWGGWWVCHSVHRSHSKQRGPFSSFLLLEPGPTANRFETRPCLPLKEESPFWHLKDLNLAHDRALNEVGEEVGQRSDTL